MAELAKRASSVVLPVVVKLVLPFELTTSRLLAIGKPCNRHGKVILSPEAWELASTDFVAAKTPQVLKKSDVYSFYGSPM